MSPLALTLYILVWPAIVTGVLFVISRAFFAELRQARREGRDVI